LRQTLVTVGNLLTSWLNGQSTEGATETFLSQLGPRLRGGYCCHCCVTRRI